MRLIRGLLAGAVGGVLLAFPVTLRAEEPKPAPAAPAPAPATVAAHDAAGGAGGEGTPHRSELDDLGVKGWKINGQELPMTTIYDMALRYHGPYLVQDLVTQTLLEQAAKAQGLTVTDAEVDEAVKDLRMRTGMSEEEPFQRFLQGQRITPEATGSPPACTSTCRRSSASWSP